ncbi:hypothetical protein PHYC_03109 [Phycisphaerales bacterium]|nr:hypothetical protein PHYC_03109 [Phycisphaerales bacterium]
MTDSPMSVRERVDNAWRAVAMACALLKRVGGAAGLRVVFCCVATIALSGQAFAQPTCPVPSSGYLLQLGGGNCSGACRGTCDTSGFSGAAPLVVEPRTCTSPTNSGEDVFRFDGGFARPGELFVSSSATASNEPGIPVANGACAAMHFTDVIFTGPAGATSVEVTIEVEINALFAGGYAQNWSALLGLGRRSMLAAGNTSEQRWVSYTATISLNGGTPVSQSAPQSLRAVISTQEYAWANDTVSGQASLTMAQGCAGGVFRFSLPGCSASSVSAGIVANRFPSDPPVIMLNGPDVVVLPKCHGVVAPYVEGVLAADDCDGPVPVTVAGDVGSEPGLYMITYNAVDSEGNAATPATRAVFVVDTTPVAEAGGDRTVNELDPVILDGSASHDPQDEPLQYAWTQIAGDPVALDVTDPVHPTFVAPQVASGGATLTFRLVVNDGGCSGEPDIVNVTVAHINHAPVALAGDDQFVAEASPVALDASSSYDQDDDVLAYNWTQMEGAAVTLDLTDPIRPAFTAPLVGPAGETLTFGLVISDGLDIGVDIVTVFVESVNHTPIADAGADQTLLEGTTVSINGMGSSDPDSDLLTYSWQQIAGPAAMLSNPADPSPTFTAPPVPLAGATLVFRLTVNDGLGGAAQDDVQITVQSANTPPDCSLARPSVAQLWPPNHKMVPVSILGVTDPENANVAIVITGVTQDEPIGGLGDGDTAPDAVVQGSTVLLRAERASGRNGRVYRVSFLADDGAGGICTGMVRVCVPQSMGRGATCIEDAEVHDSIGQ